MNFIKRKLSKISKRRIVTVSICLLVFVMSLGYAALSQHMDIDGIAQIDRSWIVKITNAYSTVANGGIDDGKTYVGTTITLNTTLPTATSTVTYTITLSNEGNIPAKLSTIEKIEDENYTIIYEIEGVVEGTTILQPGETNTVKVTIKYQNGITNVSNTKKSIMLAFNYIENSGNSGTNSGDSTSTSEYIAYKPGDEVTLDPGDGTERLFYVITTNDTTSNSTVELMSADLVGNPHTVDAAQSFITTYTESWTKASSVSFANVLNVAAISGFKLGNHKDYLVGNSLYQKHKVTSWLVKSDTYPTLLIPFFGPSIDDNKRYYMTIDNNGYIKVVDEDEPVIIRPVITVSKDYLKTYELYKTGDKVTLVDNSTWYVTKTSGSSNAMVTLASSLLTDSQGNLVRSSPLYRAFDTSGKNSYDVNSSTNIGYFINNSFLPKIKSKINSAGGNTSGLSARLITKDELEKRTLPSCGGNGFCPSFVEGPVDSSYWTMTSSGTTNVYIHDMDIGPYMSSKIATATDYAVLPVITTLKSNIKNIDLGRRITFVDNIVQNDTNIDFSKSSTYNSMYKQSPATSTSSVDFSSTSTYYFGKSYTFDEQTGRYSLVTTASGTWPVMGNTTNTNNYTTHPYTCKSTSSTGTCTTLYKITGYTSTTVGTGYALNSTGIGDILNNGQGLYQTFRNTEGSKQTYYFRGNITNNYVDFADQTWRIVRINEDGSIRIVRESSIVTREYNASNYDNAYVGFKYGTAGSGTYAATHTNANSSIAKGILEGWYETTLASYANYLVDAGFCADRSTLDAGFGTEISNYAGLVRYTDDERPMFKCPQANDLYTTSTSTKGNKSLEYPIGLLTMDELLAAGAKEGINYNVYLSGSSSWTMTPALFAGAPGAFIFDFASSGYTVYSSPANSRGLRPVISLKANVSKLSGTGTSSDPYRIS